MADPRHEPGRGLAALVGTLTVSLYVLAFRVHDIENNFPLLGEQVRDWSIAQRTLADLPWIGPRSVTSGLDIGPVYYWCLWAGRVLLTPILGPLPHTGGWAVALLGTLGDGVLLAALSRRLRSWWLAAGVVVLSATAPLDASLSAVIWNPPVAEAFAKLAGASVLWPGRASLPRSALTITLALCAVQCHVSAALVAIPLVGWCLWAVGRERGMRAVATAALLGLAGLAAWAGPYMVRSADLADVPGGGAGVARSLVSVAADPLGRLRPLESARALSGALETVLLLPFEGSWLGWLVLFGGITLAARVRDGALLAASLGPVATAVGAFALWQGRFGEAYWFLVVSPAAVLCCVGPIIAMTGRIRSAGVVALLATTIIVQPARARLTWTAWKQPAYGPLAAGISAAASGAAVRDVRTAFALPPGMDPLFMFSLAGGRLDAQASLVLVIDPDGRARYEAAR